MTPLFGDGLLEHFLQRLFTGQPPLDPPAARASRHAVTDREVGRESGIDTQELKKDAHHPDGSVGEVLGKIDADARPIEPIEVPLESACVEALAFVLVPRLAVFHPLRLRSEGILESSKRLAAVPVLVLKCRECPLRGMPQYGDDAGIRTPAGDRAGRALVVEIGR